LQQLKQLAVGLDLRSFLNDLQEFIAIVLYQAGGLRRATLRAIIGSRFVFGFAGGRFGLLPDETGVTPFHDETPHIPLFPATVCDIETPPLLHTHLYGIKPGPKRM
jgi:hypothetical protein